MSRDAFFLTIASVLVVLGVVLAFTLVGSPSHARSIALDDRREKDLDEIETLLQIRYSTGTGGRSLPTELPADLPERHDRRRLLFDPETGRPYTYERIDASRFRLCATFDLPSSDIDRDVDPRSVAHGAGTVCRSGRIEERPVRRTFFGGS